MRGHPPAEDHSPSHDAAARVAEGDGLPEVDEEIDEAALQSAIVPGAHAGQRIDQSLAQLFPVYSRSRLKDWLVAGRITVDGGRASPAQKVRGGEHVTLAPFPEPSDLAFEPEDIALPIVFEDESLIVVDKPAGLVVHPAAGNWSGTLLNALLFHDPRLASIPRAGIVHRLDKDTTGLMVVARTLVAQTDLVRQLQARTVGREYVALVHGVVAGDGTVDAPIGRHPRERTMMATVPSGKPAVTHYAVLERFAETTLLRCRLETGRTHQIRVHLASIGHPLVGDPVYRGRGAKRAEIGFTRQALHAERLALRHPVTKEEMRWTAPIPADFAAVLAALRRAVKDVS
jgi:23S rRNA pseudouridine1911/1915/1917 synthase